MNKRNKKEGISLIILVITIIVMIIIAAAVILSLSSNGIIGKTNQAVDDTNINTIEEAANLAYGELMIEKVQNITIERIIQKMKESGVRDKDIKDYIINFDGTKVFVTKNIAGAWDGSSSNNVEKNGTTYEIYTAQDLAWVKDQVAEGKTFEGDTIKLMNDIDFGATWNDAGKIKSGKIWTGIGNYNAGMFFKGTLHGNGKAISNIYCKNDSVAYIGDEQLRIYYSGLINVADQAAIINLTVKDSYIQGTQAGAIIGGCYNTTIINCHNENSKVYANIDTPNSGDYHAGGIVGAAPGVTMYACTNSGKITSNENAYGIVAYTGTLDDGEFIIKFCENFGDLEGTNVGLYYGE